MTYETVETDGRFRYCALRMKLSLLVGILLVMSPLARAATDAGEHYLGAYFLIQEAEDAEKAGDWISADAKFDGALKVLTEIRAENTDWQPILVEFRVRSFIR